MILTGSKKYLEVWSSINPSLLVSYSKMVRNHLCNQYTWVTFTPDGSDNADRRHLEDLVKARYPADKVYFQSVRQK